MYDGKETGYYISDGGRVYNKDFTVKPPTYAKGYVKAPLYIRGVGKKQLSVHREVAKAFIPNPYNLPEVNHIDGDKTNNDYTNLEWCTSQQNIIHSVDTGLKHTAVHPYQVVAICKLLEKDKYSYKEIAKKIGLDPKNGANIVRSIKHRKAWVRYSEKYNIPNTKEFHSERLDEATVRMICSLLQAGYENTEISKMIGCRKGVVDGIRQRRYYIYISKDYKFKIHRKWYVVQDAIDNLIIAGYSTKEILDKMNLPDEELKHLRVHISKRRRKLHDKGLAPMLRNKPQI